MLAFAFLFTAIPLRMRLAFVVLLARRLRLRLRRARFRGTRLGLRLRRAHLAVRLRLRLRLRRRTRCFHAGFRPALLRLAGRAHLRRLVVRALLQGRCRVAVETIRLLATALRLRLRLRCLRQLWARLKGVAFVTRRTGCAFALRRACRHAGGALRCLRGLRLGRALLRRSGARLRARTIGGARRHQRLRARPRLAAVLWLRTFRVRRADQTLWPVRTVLLRRSARLAAGACRPTLPILRGATQTEPRCLRSYGSGRHSGTGLTSHGRDAGAHVAARPRRASARQRTAL